MLKVKISGLPLRGFHDYKWDLREKIKYGDQLILRIETRRFRETSTFPVAALRCRGNLEEKIGHVPKDFSWCFKVILRSEDGEISAKVIQGTPVRGYNNGEEILCDFIIRGRDIPEVRNALYSLYKFIREPNWAKYQPEMQLIKEGNKEVSKEWSLAEGSDAQQKQDDIPVELDNDPYTRSLYEKAIKEGVEEDKSIRIMVVGCYGQGKTSLVNKLLGEEVDNVDSTNGIDVIRFETKEDNVWKRRTNDVDADTDIAKRLVKVSYPKDREDKEKTGKDKKKRERLEVSSSVLYTPTKAKKSRKDTNDSDDGLDETSDDEIHLPSSCNSDIAIFSSYSSEVNDPSQNDNTKDYLSGNIWDFGGQYIFYATHQLFHSQQAIYLLIFDLSLGLDSIIKDEDFPSKRHEKPLKDYIRFWVTSVRSFVGTEHGEPYIILVGTHKDKIEVNQDVDEYFESVRKIFDGTKQLKHIHHQHFAISNVEPDEEEFNKLRKEIISIGVHLAKKRPPLPARWIILEKNLKEKQHEQIVKFENVLAVNKEMQYPLEDQCEVKLFLNFHHTRGSLFYFNDSELSKYIILDPQYLIDAFRCIISSGKFFRKSKWRSAWIKLLEDAVLEIDLINEAWGKNPERKFMQHKEVLLGFLQRHRILSPVVPCKETDILSSTSQEVGCHIVPSLLKTRLSARLVSRYLEGKVTTQVALVYEFENDCIVETIFHRVIAAALGKWQALWFEGQRMLFEHLSIFEIQVDHAGMFIFKEDKLELLVINRCPPENVSSQECDLFRRTFEGIASSEFQKLRVDEESLGNRYLSPNSVRCYHERHGLYGSDNVHLITTLKKLGKVSICCPDNESHSFVCKEIIEEWYNTACVIKTAPKREFNLRECGKLSSAFGNGWPFLAIELGFSKSEIEHIEMNFSHQTRMGLQMLTEWQQDQGEEATLDVLVKAIHNIPSKDLNIDKDILQNVIDGNYM